MTEKTVTRPMTVVLPDEGTFGPAMLALPSDRQRAFVLALLEQGGRGGFQRAYIQAGYSGEGGVVRVSAWKLAHDDRIQEAIREEAQKRLGGAGILATSVLVEMLNDDATKKPLRAKIAGMILNRVGLHEKTEHKVSVKKEMTEADKLAAIEKLAGILGVDAKTLLGEQYSLQADKQISKPAHDMVDAEFTVVEEVEPTSEGIEDLL